MRSSYLSLVALAFILFCVAFSWGDTFDKSQAGVPRPRISEDTARPHSTAEEGAKCIGPSFDDTTAFQAAIDSGRTVYAPALGGSCHITRPLIMRTPGQILYGDGRARTHVVVTSGFVGEGVFVSETREPGPIWRDLSIQFVQADSDDSSVLNRYPPAFFVKNTPRFQIEHIGCYSASICIDMRGNSGGAIINDLQFSAFRVGIYIDGSLDTVRITDPHWFPFAMTKKQRMAFLAQGKGRVVAIESGRADDLILRGGLFLGGLALHIFKSEAGVTFGTIDGTDFDTCSGIHMEAGLLQVAAVDLTMGVGDSQAVLQSGGTMTIVSSNILVSRLSGKPAVEANGGNLIITSSNFAAGHADVTLVDQSGGNVMTLSDNRFSRAANMSYTKPTLSFRGGRTIAIGNYSSDKGTGSGQFMEITNDNPFNKIIGNSSPGWPSATSSLKSWKGVYMFN